MNMMTARPKLVTLGIGLTMTFGLGIISGILEAQQAHAVIGIYAGSVTHDVFARSGSP